MHLSARRDAADDRGDAAGPLEPTNEAYAIAKIAGIKLCQAYRKQYGSDFTSAMPTNLYGPNDNFDLTSSHVLPAMIRKFREANAKASANDDLAAKKGRPGLDYRCMPTISLKAHFDGETIRLDEPFDLAPNTQLMVTVLPPLGADRDGWLPASLANLARAYGEEEPDYPDSSVRHR